MDYEKMWYMLKRELLKGEKYSAEREVLLEMDKIEIAVQIEEEEENGN